jgi:hypothetical protein
MIMGSPLNGGAGLTGTSGRKTANASEKNAMEINADITAHFIFVERNIFIDVFPIAVQ